MNSKSLNPKQVARLAKQTRKIRHWLDCLTGRMHQKQFPNDDPLKVAAEEAHGAAAGLDDAVKQIQAKTTSPNRSKKVIAIAGMITCTI